MASLLLRNIQTLITCDEHDRILHNVDLYCEDGFIKAIGPHLPRPPIERWMPVTAGAIPD